MKLFKYMKNWWNINDIRKFIRFIDLYESYLLGLLSGCIVIFLLYMAFMKYMDYNLFCKCGLIYLGIFELICIIYWLYKNFYIWGRNNGKKLKIVLAIDSSLTYEWYILKTDFIKELKKNINNKKFKIITLPHRYHKNLYINEHQKKLDENYMKKLNKKIKGHYWICGNVEKQKNGGIKCYIETTAMVFHHKIQESVKHAFSNEFGKVYEKNLEFFNEQYKTGITFSGEYSAIVAKYIIGIAAFLSKDFLTARELHKDLYDDANKLKGMIEKGTKKNERVFKEMIESIKNIQLIELKFIGIIVYSQIFKKDQFNSIYKSKEERLNDRKSWLDTLDSYAKKYGNNAMICDALASYAIYEFLSKRDIKRARYLIKRSKEVNYMYEYSLIFLDLYSKKYDLAKERMEKIINKKDHNIKDINFYEIICFIDIVLDEDKGHEELLYWQAVIFYKKLKEPLCANERIYEYLKRSNYETKEYEIIPAQELQKQIEKNIPIND